MSDTSTTIAALDAVDADPKMRAEREGVWNDSMITLTTNRDRHWESEAAWERYQERLGNLTTNEEAAIRRAFLSGYAEGEAERNAVQ